MIAWLGNVNLDPVRGLAAGDDGEAVHVVPYGQMQRELLDESSPLWSPEVRRAVVVLEGGELAGDALHRLPTAEVRAPVVDAFSSLVDAIARLADRRPELAIAVTNVVLPPLRFPGPLEVNAGPGFRALEDELDARLAEAARGRPNLLVLDWRRIVLQHGWERLHGASFWYLGRIKLNLAALELLAVAARRLFDAYVGRTRKVLVVDLDDTVWGGIVGEVGPEGIELSEDGVGKAYRDLQKAIRSLTELGVLLAVASKNTEAVALDAFDHPMMVLRLGDLAARRIGWGPKVQSLVELAAELDLGLDAFVFLDDSPVERELVRRALPEIAVPEPPADPAERPAWFQEAVVATHFSRLVLTESDRGKTEQYRARRERLELRDRIGLDSYLAELGIRLTLHTRPRRFRARLAQLTQKTSQFNMTTERLTEADVVARLEDPRRRTFALAYADRFGDEGIVGAAFASLDGDVLAIDNFLLSCRILGRTVEQAFLAAVLRALDDGRDRELVARFAPTARNAVAAAFYPACGLAPDANGGWRGRSAGIAARLAETSRVEEVRVDDAG